MNQVKYLTDIRTIVETRYTERPLGGHTLEGYTLRKGAPTSLLIRLEGESRWRRVYVWCFANAGTAFVRILGKPFILRDYDVSVSLV